MKNALLFRFMLVCSVIMLVMTLISIIQYFFWSDQQAADQRSADVVHAVDVIARETAQMIERDETMASLDEKAAMLEKALDMRIYIVDASGQNKKLIDMYDVEALKAHRQDIMRSAMGSPVLRKRVQDEEAQMLYCAPVLAGETAVGAVVALANLSKLDEIAQTGRYFILLMSLGSALMALSIIGLYAFRFLRPIVDLETAVVKLSAGENPGNVFSAGKYEIASIVNIFNYMQKNFVEAEATRREFLASISHDLRSPLTSIYGYIKAMRDGVITPKDYPKTLDIVTREVHQLIKLTGDVLEAAKMEYGRLKLFKEYVPLGQTMREIVEQMNAYESIKKQVVCQQEVVVYADASRLKQVFTNIVTNACKYNCPNGSVTITVSQKGAFGIVEVADTGYGISDADQAHIFEKFFRVDKARNREKEGSGLGLYVSKKLVEQHQGHIYIKSTIGKGSTMTVELPI